MASAQNKKSNHRLIPLLVATIVLLLAILGTTFYMNRNPDKTPGVVDSFEDCAAGGNTVLLSYPEQCIHNGQTFIRELTEKEKRQSQQSKNQ